VTRFDQIPAEIRERDQWVNWRRERRRDGKGTKVPYRADGMGRASSTDPATWSTFEAAVAGVEALPADGIGYVFSADDPFTGIDLDDCLDGDRLHPEAAAIVLLLDSYTEISPSGTGVKVIVRASKNGNTRSRTSNTPWGGKLEVYDQDRFFWQLATHMRAELVLDALEMANGLRRPEVGLIAHSDRGSQLTFNRSSQRFVVDLIVNTRSALPPVSSIRVSCGVGC
jgi:primase-polymerase (primpol)-like protein